MEKPKSSTPSLGDVARAAGVSKAAACYALRNYPSVSKATRERVQLIAQQLGYAPDARITSWMAKVRGAKTKELLPIAWLNAHGERDAWHKYKFLSPYLEGAQERALQLGYRIEEIWAHQPGLTMRRISQILYQRGIEGIIITNPIKRLRLDWDHLAGISIENSLQTPDLHRVIRDDNFNILLALKSLRRFGYRHIGVCFSDRSDRLFHHLLPAIFHYFHSTIPEEEQVPPLFYAPDDVVDSPVVHQQIATWLSTHRPDVVLGHSSHILHWIQAAGYRVPEDIGVVHVATDDDVSDWAGICANRRPMGATAAELVISFIQNRQLGIPKVVSHTAVRGTWHGGRTLLVPKPG